tara:strand:+ start:1701 stop:2030 length:330 start_codon:yes stop_codon:yes gene_type:complete
MVGILAKKRINILKRTLQICKSLTKEETEDVFTRILISKYTRNPKHKEALLNTGSHVLLEFVRSAQAQYIKHGKVERWGGMHVDGIIYGDNQQGSLQMKVRNILINQNL